MEDCLDKLGMPQLLVRQLTLVLKTIRDLITGIQAATALSETCRTKVPQNLPDEDSLAQLLYAYLVQWLGE